MKASSSRTIPRSGVRKQARDFTAHRYHQPSDEYSPDMDFTGDAVIAKILALCSERRRHGCRRSPAGFPAMNSSPHESRVFQ